jgi:hypothetical protein
VWFVVLETTTCTRYQDGKAGVFQDFCSSSTSSGVLCLGATYSVVAWIQICPSLCGCLPDYTPVKTDLLIGSRVIPLHFVSSILPIHRGHLNTCSSAGHVNWPLVRHPTQRVACSGPSFQFKHNEPAIAQPKQKLKIASFFFSHILLAKYLIGLIRLYLHQNSLLFHIDTLLNQFSIKIGISKSPNCLENRRNKQQIV